MQPLLSILDILSWHYSLRYKLNSFNFYVVSLFKNSDPESLEIQDSKHHQYHRAGDRIYMLRLLCSMDQI